MNFAERVQRLKREIRDLKTAAPRSASDVQYYVASKSETIDIEQGMGQRLIVTVTFETDPEEVPVVQCGIDPAYLYLPENFDASDPKQVVFSFTTTVNNTSLDVRATVVASQPIESITVEAPWI